MPESLAMRASNKDGHICGRFVIEAIIPCRQTNVITDTDNSILQCCTSNHWMKFCHRHKTWAKCANKAKQLLLWGCTPQLHCSVCRPTNTNIFLQLLQAADSHLASLCYLLLILHSLHATPHMSDKSCLFACILTP